jgi:hypothetical protein
VSSGGQSKPSPGTARCAPRLSGARRVRRASAAGTRRPRASCPCASRRGPRVPSRPCRYEDCHTGSRTHPCGRRTAHRRTPPSPRAATRRRPAREAPRRTRPARTRRSRLLRGHLQQPQESRVLRSQPCQLSLNRRRDLSNMTRYPAAATGRASSNRADGPTSQLRLQHAPAKRENAFGGTRVRSHRLRSFRKQRLKQQGWKQSWLTTCDAMRPEGSRKLRAPSFCMQHGKRG